MNPKKLFLLLIVIFTICCRKINAQSDSTIFMHYLKTITKTEGYRNYRNTVLLNKTVEYILSVFRQYADTVYYRPYQVNRTIYKNVVCRFGSNKKKPLVVIGAHYDVCGNRFFRPFELLEIRLRCADDYKYGILSQSQLSPCC
jgi:hypothetical protein